MPDPAQELRHVLPGSVTDVMSPVEAQAPVGIVMPRPGRQHQGVDNPWGLKRERIADPDLQVRRLGGPTQGGDLQFTFPSRILRYAHKPRRLKVGYEALLSRSERVSPFRAMRKVDHHHAQSLRRGGLLRRCSGLCQPIANAERSTQQLKSARHRPT